MSFREHTMWSVVCDFDGCGEDAQENSEFRAWSDHQSAVSDAEGSAAWAQIDGKHYCAEHWHNCERIEGPFDEVPGSQKTCGCDEETP